MPADEQPGERLQPDAGAGDRVPALTALAAQVYERIGRIPAADWDRCAGGDDPFLSHAYLSALEESGCVSEATGFRPRHLVLRDGPAGALAGVVPLYLKSHSNGEYGPDASWADHYRGPSKGYYPKLLSEVPFTPATGRRLLLDPATDRAEAAWKALPALLAQVGNTAAVSSVHLNYLDESSAASLLASNPVTSYTVQYRWTNRGYSGFGDFLDALRNNYARSVMRERAGALAGGLTVRILEGDAIGPAQVDFLYRIYADTNARHGSALHLNRAFFEILAATLRGRMLVVMAFDGERPLAACLSLKGASRLYLRYWGALEARKFLHFEVTYYQAIDYAIRHGLASIDGGAAGPHKLARGFQPALAAHLHWMNDHEFVNRERAFLEGQRNYVVAQLEAARQRRVYAAH